MSHKAILQTEGFIAFFVLDKMENTDEYFHLSLELRLDPLISNISIQSVLSKIHVNDLQMLVWYFTHHIQHLGKNQDFQSSVFVPLELGFQLAALSGEVRGPSDGEFTVRLMLNVGFNPREGTRVYLGGEAVVTLQNIDLFVIALHSVINRSHHDL